MKMRKITTIPLSPRTRDALKRLGRKGETYDDILRRLIMIVEQVDFVERQSRILREEEFTPLDDI